MESSKMSKARNASKKIGNHCHKHLQRVDLSKDGERENKTQDASLGRGHHARVFLLKRGCCCRHFVSSRCFEVKSINV